MNLKQNLYFACAMHLMLLGTAACKNKEGNSSESFIEARTADVRTNYLPNNSGSTMAQAELPIGVFDSGMGGLTVLNAILTLDEFNNSNHTEGADGKPDFAGENFIYLGDQTNMPYGNYPAHGREDFLRELILKDAVFLLGRTYYSSGADRGAPKNDKLPVKAIVIACNTATAYGLDDLRNAVKKWNLPILIVGVVEAGARGVLALGNSKSVAILATVGTCKSNAYPNSIAKLATSQSKAQPRVIQHGSLALAGSIEGDPEFVPRGSSQADAIAGAIRSASQDLAETQARENPGIMLDTVVLGCTHFPLVQNQISAALSRLRNARDTNGRYLYKNQISETIRFVDPSALTARELYLALKSSDLFAKSSTPKNQHNRFFISKPNVTLPEVRLTADGGLQKEYKLSRPLGRYENDTTRYVPLQGSDISPAVQRLIRKAMPRVWKSIEDRA